MARPKKRGIDYFSFDVDFFSDKKIRILKSRFGADGITIYLYLLCEIYRNGYYIKIDEDYEYLIADDLGMSSEKVKQVLKFLLERSLLDSKLFQSDTIATSQGIQRRFQEAIKTRASKSDIEVDKKYWLLSNSETQPFIKFTQNLSYSEKNPSYSEKNPSYSEKNDTKESKGKESKENTIVEQNSTETKIPYLEIIAYLNEKTGKHFKHDSKATQRVINGRFSDGFSLEDFKKVIDLKCSQWKDDSKMSAYLRPETLFAPSHFESYLNEVPQKEKKTEIAKSEIEEDLVGDDWMEINQNGG